MRAILYASFGGPEVMKLETVSVPEPRNNEVLVRVRAAGVNPIDWKLREGLLAEGMNFPLTPGGDLAGEIAALGAEVQGWEVGQAVFGDIQFGAFAEYAVAAVDLLAPKPAKLDFIQAAGVPLASMTAWQALFDQGGLSAGQTVLIHGATGGVGHFAVQLAKWKGARVIGVTSSSALKELVDLGADEAIPYDGAYFESLVRDLDMVLDLVGAPDIQEKSMKVLHPGGILVSTVREPSQEEADRHGVRARWFRMKPSGCLLREIGRLFDEGALRVIISQVLPLEEARSALELSQMGRTLGKIALRME